MAKKSTQEPSWMAPVKHIAVCSPDKRDAITRWLEVERTIDKANHQMMLNVVDISSLTKAKITALGKLGKQYNKASIALIKKYKTAKIIDWKETHEWITQY